MVGRGACVLCSSHPELATHWLEMSAEVAAAGASAGKSAAGGCADAAAYMSKIELLAQALEDSAEGRRQFLRVLLEACCDTSM